MSAIFIGPALGLNWLFGVAIAVSIVLGSLARKDKWGGHHTATRNGANTAGRSATRRVNSDASGGTATGDHHPRSGGDHLRQPE